MLDLSHGIVEMSENSNEDWTPCEGGEISGMVIHLKQLRRKVAIQRGITATVCVLSLITVGTVYWNQQSNTVPLSHQAALELLPEYQAGRLDQATTARMEEHLAHCKACRDKLEQMNGEESLLEPDSPIKTVGFRSGLRDSLIASAH